MLYVDASALVKRYVREAGSVSVRRRTRSHALATSRITEVEVVSALSRRVREGLISPIDSDRAAEALRNDLTSMILVELSPGVVQLACDLLGRHALRTGDAIQLASCLFLERETDTQMSLLAFDARLTAAGKAEGLVPA